MTVGRQFWKLPNSHLSIAWDCTLRQPTFCYQIEFHIQHFILHLKSGLLKWKWHEYCTYNDFTFYSPRKCFFFDCTSSCGILVVGVSRISLWKTVVNTVATEHIHGYTWKPNNDWQQTYGFCFCELFLTFLDFFWWDSSFGQVDVPCQNNVFLQTPIIWLLYLAAIT